jgi:hypothetical protein
VGQLERRAEVISGEFNSQKHHFENISEHVQGKKSSVCAFMLNSKINFSVIFRLLFLLSLTGSLICLDSALSLDSVHVVVLTGLRGPCGPGLDLEVGRDQD